MAQGNISVTESQFRCPICLDIWKDPVSIPCGHTYCISCINCYWDQANSGLFSCPQCRETFNPRPVLRRNTVLVEMVDKLKRNEMDRSVEPEPFLGRVGDVACDFCPVENKMKAEKSCLVCLASFCELHILPHRDVGMLRRHKLVAAVENLAEHLCAHHRLGLEGGGCDGDAAEWSGDCLLCESDQDELHNLDAQRARKQAKLQECQRVVQGRIQSRERELEEFQQSLESLKVSALAMHEDNQALFTDLALRLDKTRTEVRARLEAKERAVVGRAERDVETLERELEELRERDAAMSRLLLTEDHLHFLQVERDAAMSRLLLTEDHLHFLQAASLLSVPLATRRRPSVLSQPLEAFAVARRALVHLRPRMEELCREEVDKITRALNDSSSACNSLDGECVKALPLVFPLSSLSLQPADQRMRATFQRYSCRLSLDPETAHPTLVLLEDPQGVHCGEEPQPYPAHPLRFDSVAQVLCREGQVGGASYWEVEWRGGGWVDVGVTYRDIGRKGGGKPCLLGRNESSWRLRCTLAGYAAWHHNRKVTVAAPPCARVGVLLERHKGALSFYSVGDTVSLLHTFHCAFTQPLYPAFRLDLDATLLLCCPLEGNSGNAAEHPH